MKEKTENNGIKIKENRTLLKDSGIACGVRSVCGEAQVDWTGESEEIEYREGREGREGREEGALKTQVEANQIKNR